MSDYRYYVQANVPGEEPCVYTHPDPNDSQIQVPVYTNFSDMAIEFAKELSRDFPGVKYSVLRYKDGLPDVVIMEYLDGDNLIAHGAFE